jgi:hypothetical protein
VHTTNVFRPKVVETIKSVFEYLSPVGNVIDAVFGVKPDGSVLQRHDARRNGQPEVIDVVGNKKLVVRKVLLCPKVLLAAVGKD